ncbi:mago nashi-like protein,putative [Trypanosoma brucei gambiense DAL972]|nr:mago nashi-like protein,putative [Trypanosoma brucei gambiense DAL972]RHW72191.1 mago nashi-like protein [Trypanosoma brucei equiperdum]CBH11997.1 mago nashi-like protein,putative [Trypanosoma brucei gambiense DAL972]|eukprot:XP_011774282.1 mago nashi-like protein,putative [Trypanosoma brucei gambiense DAL972]
MQAEETTAVEVLEEAPVQETMQSCLHYVRYFAGHTGRYGNEFLEFDIRDDGTLKYGNNSRYRNENIIKKQARISPAVLEEIKRLIILSGILERDDECWPQPDRNGRQELEIHLGDTHISFVTNKITSLSEVESPDKPKGLDTFYYFVRDIKALVLALVSLHFKIKAW